MATNPRNFSRMLRNCFIILSLSNSFLHAGPRSIASQAIATASSSLSLDQAPWKVTDEHIRLLNMHEWVSTSQITFWGQIDYPWIQLDWDSSRFINRIILYDRPTLQSHTAGGILHFSDGSQLPVYQIPNDGRPKVVSFPPKKVEWIRFEVTDGDGVHLGLSEMEVYPSPVEYPDYVSWVDPYIETTRGRYFFFVTGSLPFGMISSAPMTRNKNQYGGGYNYNSLEILGFPQIHAWMLSGVNFMPITGTIDYTGGEQAWKSSFTHDGEIVQPGYHRVYLEDYDLWLEQTATDRVSMYRITYTKENRAGMLLNLGGYLSTATMTNAHVRKVSDSQLEGFFYSTGRLWGGPENVKIYFAVQFDQAFDGLTGWSDSILNENITELTGPPGSTPRMEQGWSYHDAPGAGVCAAYEVEAGEELQVKFAISYTSMENAWNNLIRECNHWDFDRVKKEAQDEWNNWLGRIKVKGGSHAQKVKFYSDLWHVLLGRHKIDDYNGDYPDYTQGTRLGSHTINATLQIRSLPKTDEGKTKFHMYNSDAFWLTQWNLNVLWGLAWPQMIDEFSACLVQYADNGKLLPRGPCAGAYSYIMTGCPATHLITSGFQKGLLTKTDVLHAFEVMKYNHMPGGMMEIDDFYIDHGYHPNNAGITLEAAFQDWALSQMAKDLNLQDDYTYFLNRSNGWKNLFHKGQKLILPKDGKGNWLHLNPLSGSGWVEANAWQATWSVSFDIHGLADLMGDADMLSEKLNYAFEQAAPQDFVFGYGQGYVSYANQPGCSNAHVFNHAGKPWLSQYWVRRVNEQAYGAISPDKGYGGHDEDQGQMGGISALMSMGLFSLRGTAASEPVYELTSPVFDEIVITLDSTYYAGKSFVIKAHNNSDLNCYIQKATLNGQDLSNFWFRHSDFATGGILELWLGPTPNKKWGTGMLPK
jgi:predicted alpha-1,2-mannosidase